jgi:hypothetical protein
MSEIKVPISPGELLDKITILRIKSARISDPQKVGNVRSELRALEQTWAASEQAKAGIEADVTALLEVNERLWVIEDEFISLARSVYFENDERALIKRRINMKLGSNIVEEKSYAGYKA